MPSVLAFIVFIIMTCCRVHSFPRAADLSYDYGEERGPEKWPTLFATCAGQRQSPVDVQYGDSRTAQHAPLLYSHYWNTGVATITNNEYTVQISLNTTTEPTVSGGPLSEEYVFDQLHFHWGPNDTVGSEHTLNGQSYSMEAHLVHHKKSYGSFSNALNYQDGLAVVAFILQAGAQSDNTMFHKLSRNIAKVTEPYSSHETSQWDALRWFHDHSRTGGYFTYQGSLTSPPCSEVVTWIVYPRVIHVSSEQMDPFRQIKTKKGVLSTNYRPTQLLHQRPVSLTTTVINDGILHHGGEGFSRLLPQH